MPEGPELTFCSTYFNKILKNHYFTTINSFTDKPVILPEDFNCKILEINNKGKLMWFKLLYNNLNYYIHIHYGITGWLVLNKPDKYLKFELEFLHKNKKTILYMKDKRRFSKIKFLNEKEHLAALDKIGIDIFTKQFTLKYFKDIIKSKNTILAGLLLKQELFSGIGNYIKNEALYLTNLNAKIKTNELNDNQIKKLYQNILFVSYSKLYTELDEYDLRKYLNKDKINHVPKNLEIPYSFKIYNQENTPDGEKVIKIKVAGRDSYCIKSLCH